jgi:hypothetical protein
VGFPAFKMITEPPGDKYEDNHTNRGLTTQGEAKLLGLYLTKNNM